MSRTKRFPYKMRRADYDNMSQNLLIMVEYGFFGRFRTTKNIKTSVEEIIYMNNTEYDGYDGDDIV
jgi:hypothetical protein